MDDSFPKWLATELERRMWSMRELARRASISHSWVADIVSGVKPPSWDFCSAIAKPLGYRPVEMFIEAGLVPMEDIKMVVALDTDDADPRLIKLFTFLNQLSDTEADLILDAWRMILRVVGFDITIAIPNTPEDVEKYNQLEKELREERIDALQEMVRESARLAEALENHKERTDVDRLQTALHAQSELMEWDTPEERKAFLRGLSYSDRDVYNILDELRRRRRRGYEEYYEDDYDEDDEDF